jgi:hypothetical protein
MGEKSFTPEHEFYCKSRFDFLPELQGATKHETLQLDRKIWLGIHVVFSSLLSFRVAASRSLFDDPECINPLRYCLLIAK